MHNYASLCILLYRLLYSNYAFQVYVNSNMRFVVERFGTKFEQISLKIIFFLVLQRYSWAPHEIIKILSTQALVKRKNTVIFMK